MPGTWTTGRRGEEAAAEYLAERGWRVLAKNYRAGPKEIDLIVARAGVVAFVEVKTRATASGGAPLEPIGRAKRRSVEAAARRWIAAHGPPGAAYRFDALAVTTFGGRLRIEHVPDAWRPGT